MIHIGEWRLTDSQCKDESVVYIRQNMIYININMHKVTIPYRLILNKFRIYGMFSGENIASCLAGWKTPHTIYSATAETRTCDLPHRISIAIGKVSCSTHEANIYKWIMTSLDLWPRQFSFVTNVSKFIKKWKYVRPESGNTYKQHRMTPQVAVNIKCLWFNDKLTHIKDNYLDITVYIVNSNLLWIKRNLYVAISGHHRCWPQLQSGLEYNPM